MAEILLNLDENEADIGILEELQDFDTRSEAEASSESTEKSTRKREPSISSVSSNNSEDKVSRRTRMKHERRTQASSGAEDTKKSNGSKQLVKKRQIRARSSSSSSSSSSDTDDDDDKRKKSRSNGKKRSSSRSPSKRSSNGNTGNQSTGKNYDYMTKLNYLFRDTRFFLIKSNNAENIDISKKENVWATLPQNEANLNQAFKESRNVLLIFSVNESGKFAGFARMAAESNKSLDQPKWVLPPTISAKSLGGVIKIDWICHKELSFTCTQHLYNVWNESKPVKIGRDGQEMEPKVGSELCRLFPEDETIEMTPILRKSKENAKQMREKGIVMTYRGPLKPMSSSSFQGYSSRGRNGAYRGKRPYGISYKSRPPLKRGHGHMPYRMPPWERFPSATAAAEAYVAEYMRNMHGQLPPLPFVPTIPPGTPAIQAPFGDQLPPPPPRYYDGPELAPPPPSTRPPSRKPFYKNSHYSTRGKDRGRGRDYRRSDRDRRDRNRTGSGRR